MSVKSGIYLGTPPSHANRSNKFDQVHTLPNNVKTGCCIIYNVWGPVPFMSCTYSSRPRAQITTLRMAPGYDRRLQSSSTTRRYSIKVIIQRSDRGYDTNVLCIKTSYCPIETRLIYPIASAVHGTTSS